MFVFIQYTIWINETHKQHNNQMQLRRNLQATEKENERTRVNQKYASDSMAFSLS